MKIALAQLNFHIGNFEQNTQKILTSIALAKKEHADLIVFPEMAICGYPPRDFLSYNDFIKKSIAAVEHIATYCEGIAAIIGSPDFNTNPKGKDLNNSAFFINNGKIEKKINKTLLPNYDIFEEYRYFEPNTQFEVIEYKNQRIALTICEDLWNVGVNPLYTVNPMDELIKQHPDIILNIAASPFSYQQEKTRKEILAKNAREYNLPVLYVNHVGAQTELIFDGGSLVMNAKGELVKELKYFDEDFCVINTDEIDASEQISESENNIEAELIHNALVCGIKNYFQKLGFTKAILGLSGGIDSAVTLVLAEKALGKENVKALLLPSQFSSDHSINDAKQLAETIGVSYEVVSIEETFKAFESTLNPYFKGLPFNLAEENIQARIRAVLLMAFSNKFGYILLNTSNKSEAAVGYGTLYGDMCGGLSVLGDVYKTQVYNLAAYINRENEIIPINSILKPPSAELRPDQKDSDSLPEYDILDKLLYQYIELSKDPEEIISMGFDKSMVEKVLRMVNSNEWKRYQTAPILRVSTKAFGMGRRMPIAAKYLI